LEVERNNGLNKIRSAGKTGALQPKRLKEGKDARRIGIAWDASGQMSIGTESDGTHL